jgi:hypothetical protein
MSAMYFAIWDILWKEIILYMQVLFNLYKYGVM